jgi:DnaJ-class molecular chaperone
VSGFRFGFDVPCRACHGAGQRVVAMTPEQKREHARETRRALRSGELPERMPVTKSCPDCDGRGYVPREVADGTA